MEIEIRWKDPERLRPSPEGFQCNEILEEGDVGTVTFTCTVPPHQQKEEEKELLIFSCRGRSVGMLLESEEVAEENEEEEFEKVDCHFFDKGYTLAGKTGFQIWAASRLLVEVLTWPHSSRDGPNIRKWQKCVANGAKIVELGSGIGVVGSSLAHAGGQVLLTDLPTLVIHATQPNIILNQNHRIQKDRDEKLQQQQYWNDSVPIGKGNASTMALDWTRPLPKEIQDIDIVVASDCVWLTSMFHALLDTVSSIFEKSPTATFFLSFQRRNSSETVRDNKDNNSSMFTTVKQIIDTIHNKGWTMNCIAWRPIHQINNEDKKEVFVLEIRLP